MMQISKSTLFSLSCLALALASPSLNVQAQQQQQQQQQVAPLSGGVGPSSGGQQQQQTALSGVQLQAQLNQLQQQAQRQFGQLNGLMMNAVNGSKYSNVIEAISSVGKAIHQQISQATNPNHVNIVSSSGALSGLGSMGLGGGGESANTKKNEYQSIVVTDQGSSLQPAASSSPFAVNASNPMNANYREQGEVLRQEIVRRAGQLQQVVASSMELLKNNGDLIVRRLLEQMNVRLDQAKAKADKIINEPTTSEVALRALGTINLGLNNLNNIIANIVTRLEAAQKEANQQQQQIQSNQIAAGAMGNDRQQQQQQQVAGSSNNNIQQRLQSANLPLGPLSAQLPQIIDTNRFKANLHQLSQQFQQALNGSSLSQQLALIRQQRLQQQQQMLNLSPTKQKV